MRPQIARSYYMSGYKYKPTAREVIKDNINWLISILYKPDPDLGCVIDQERLEAYIGKNPGPVNFGDLRCTNVLKNGSVGYSAHVEEAGPEAEGLRNYLEYWLCKWGWPVKVETEW